MTKITKRRITAVILVLLGLALGVTWTAEGFCLGDSIFRAIGISPWSATGSGLHYPALLGTVLLATGAGFLNSTMEERKRRRLWTGVVIILAALYILLPLIK